MRADIEGEAMAGGCAGSLSCRRLGDLLPCRVCEGPWVAQSLDSFPGAGLCCAARGWDLSDALHGAGIQACLQSAADEDADCWKRWCPNFEGILALSADQLDEYSSKAVYIASLLEQAFTRARGAAWRQW
eukprot:4242652-Pyramimonas_sp.AAC.1